jgi:hypothetical protein
MISGLVYVIRDSNMILCAQCRCTALQAKCALEEMHIRIYVYEVNFYSEGNLSCFVCSFSFSVLHSRYSVPLLFSCPL